MLELNASSPGRHIIGIACSAGGSERMSWPLSEILSFDFQSVSSWPEEVSQTENYLQGYEDYVGEIQTSILSRPSGERRVREWRGVTGFTLI